MSEIAQRPSQLNLEKLAQKLHYDPNLLGLKCRIGILKCPTSSAVLPYEILRTLKVNQGYLEGFSPSKVKLNKIIRSLNKTYGTPRAALRNPKGKPDIQWNPKGD